MQPKIKIELEPIDKLIGLIALIGAILLIAIPLIYYTELPNEIPIHFGPDGNADDYSQKGMIWSLPIIGIITYIGMYWLNKYPHIFNYPQKITEENAPKQYRIATKLIRTLNAIITCLFAYITYAIIQTALGNQNGLGSYFLPVLMIILFVPIIYYLFKRSTK